MMYAYLLEQKWKDALKIFKSELVAVGEPQNIQLLQQAFPMYIEQL